MKVLKKDGTVEEYNEQKIIDATSKSAKRSLIRLTSEDYAAICNEVLNYIDESNYYVDEYEEEIIPVEDMHAIVENVLLELFPQVGESYRQYRNYKLNFVNSMNKVYEESQKIMYIGDKENSNTDSALVSTKRSLIFNQFNKELYQLFFMTIEEMQACRDGYIYTHDMSARRDTMNCCLFDVQNVLTGGFEMGNIWYNEPKTLDVAFDVIGDIVLSAASQQYGGFTVPEVDKILAPYAKKSFDLYYNEYLNIVGKYNDSNFDKAEEYAFNKLENEFRQGFQGWEYKFNTVSSSRGDYPFITMTLGLGTETFEKMATKIFLDVRKSGQGKSGNKKPVLFPKLVFLYTEDLHGVGKINEYLFEAGIECSSKAMYPDWLSLDGDTDRAAMYHSYGKVISPMG